MSKDQKFQIGQIVSVSVSKPEVNILQGDQVAIVDISKTGKENRYKVLHLSGNTAWMYEDDLAAPIGRE